MSESYLHEPATVVPVNASELQPYECSALLFAYLAYPGASQDNQRMLAQAALCNHLLQASAQEDEDWVASPQPIKPAYFLCDTPTSRVGKDPLLTFNRCMRDRSAAVAIAKPFLQLAVHGPHLRPARSERLTLIGRAALIMPLLGGDGAKGGEDKNVLSRIWVPSLPVLHLATAVAVLLEGLPCKGKERFPVVNLLRVPEMPHYLVNEARHYEEVIASATTRPLARAGRSLIRFRLT